MIVSKVLKIIFKMSKNKKPAGEIPLFRLASRSGTTDENALRAKPCREKKTKALGTKNHATTRLKSPPTGHNN